MSACVCVGAVPHLYMRSAAPVYTGECHAHISVCVWYAASCWACNVHGHCVCLHARCFLERD